MANLILREATLADIPALQIIRNSVRENVLSNPDLVTYSDYVLFLQDRGKGWLCEYDGKIAGFAVVDMLDHNIWALFVHPDAEGKGIGRQLHDLMLDWYFAQTVETVWLGTAPNTRAEKFYRTAGWKEVGMHGSGEVKFEMRMVDWVKG